LPPFLGSKSKPSTERDLFLLTRRSTQKLVYLIHPGYKVHKLTVLHGRRKNTPRGLVYDTLLMSSVTKTIPVTGLPACRIVLQQTTLTRAPVIYYDTCNIPRIYI
jgi:hypothetical protein